jgi:glycosyltransferase involved in cell wall biosynthesis
VKRNILLLSYTFPPDNTAAAARAGQMFKYLPELGYQPVVITSSIEGSQNADACVHRVPRANEPRGVRFASRVARGFMRFFAPYDDRLPWAPYALSSSRRQMEAGEIVAIVSTSPFVAAHFAALRLKLRFGIPWIADFQDPICDNPFRSRRWFYPYDKLIERSFFYYADRLIANTDSVAEAWRARYPEFSSKVSVLWNSFDPGEALVRSAPPARPYHVLAHVGALYGERHPALLLRAVDRLGVGPDALRIKLVGPIEPRLLEQHRDLFDRMVRKGILEYGNRLVERAEALRETSEADCLLLLDLNETNASFQLPSKLLDYVRYGKPILAYTPGNSPTERILAGAGIPFVAIDPTNSEEIEMQKIESFLRLPTEQKPPSSWFEQTFSATTLAKTVAKHLDDVLTAKKR